MTIPRYIAIPNIHDTRIAEVTILTILTVLLRNAMLLVKELFEVKASILYFALLNYFDKESTTVWQRWTYLKPLAR